MSDKHKILCIDDEQDIVDALYRMFRKDYEVFTATSGTEALHILKENKIAVIICDQKMPEMNGVETLKKSIEIDPECIRILLTGYTDIESVIESINSGEVYRYMTKPWDPVDLVNTVKKSIEKYSLKKELEKAYKELQTLDQAKTQFMFLINHELKTPLTVLTSYTDILKETKIDDEQTQFISKIQQSNDKLSLIINESLNLLKAETGHLEIQKGPVDLTEVFQQLDDQFQSDLDKKKVQLNFNNGSNSDLTTDSKILKDILIRLIDNAIKFANEDSKVHIDVKNEGDKNLVSVTNTGKPVKPEIIEKILKPFSLDEDMMNHSKGLGMGLSLCHAYLKNLHSQLNITSKDNEFKVSFLI